MRETNEKEFGLRKIEIKLVRIHSRGDESVSGLKVDYFRRDIFRNNDTKSCVWLGYRR